MLLARPTQLRAFLVALLLSVLPRCGFGLELTRSGATLLADGEPVRLIGYGCYGLVAESDFDFRRFLDTIADDYQINLARVWVQYHWTNDLTPFAGTRDEGYDLLAPNEALFARLREFVAYADTKDVVVQVTLFDAVQLSGDAASNRWPNSPYNSANNAQPYLTAPSQFDDVPSAWWDEVNAPLIDRVVETLDGLGNVIYEVINEPDSHGVDTAGTEFHQAAVERLHERLHSAEHTGSRIICVNPEGAALEAWALASEEVDVIAKHVHDPGGANDFNGLAKPVIISNDGDVSQALESFGGLAPAARLARTEALLQGTFTSGAAEGHNHFEFLDKGIYGATWRGDDYDPRVENLNEDILATLARYRTTVDPGSDAIAVSSVTPAGAARRGSSPLTSVALADGSTHDALRGPALVELTGAFDAGAALDLAPPAAIADTLTGLELGTALLGLASAGERVRVYFASSLAADGTPAPELFLIEWAASTDTFRIELLANEPGTTLEVAATLQVTGADYEATGTSIDTASAGVQPLGGVAVDLDRLGVGPGAIRGLQIAAEDGLGGLTGLDPCVIAARVPPLGIGPFVRGDCNQDSESNLSDGIFLLSALFVGGAAPSCAAACDHDQSGALDLTSAIYLFNFLFLGGPPPPFPAPADGCARSSDPRDMELGCGEPEGCA